MSDSTPRDLTKLPVWAQKHIAELEMRLRERTEEVLRSGSAPRESIPADAPVVVPSYADRQFVFREADTVEFRLRSGEVVLVHHIDEGRRLSITTTRGNILMEPRAANSIYVRGEDR